MPNVNLYNMKGQNIGTIDLAETVFGAEINASAMHSYVVAYCLISAVFSSLVNISIFLLF